MQKIILILVLQLAALCSFAQLKGSGKTIAKTYDYKNFDKVYFEDLDGKLEVEIGKAFSINVIIDDNLEGLLSVTQSSPEHVLKVSFKNNRKNKLYIEETHFKIKITMPEASVIRNNGNSGLIVSGLFGRYFRIENIENGSATLDGAVDALDIINQGNGSINAKQLIAKKAKITCAGNGNVIVAVFDAITAKISGNGSVKNVGKARFDSNSSTSGNGNLINP